MTFRFYDCEVSSYTYNFSWFSPLLLLLYPFSGAEQATRLLIALQGEYMQVCVIFCVYFKVSFKTEFSEGLVSHWLTAAKSMLLFSCRNKYSKDNSSTALLPLSWWKACLPESLAIFQGILVSPRKQTNYPYSPFFLKCFDHYGHNITTAAIDVATWEAVPSQGKVVCVCTCLALDLWKSMAVVRVAVGKGLVCNSHICYKMEHFLITVFLMSSESSHPGVKMHACSRTLWVSALYSPIFKIRDSSLQSYSLYGVSISGPGLPAFDDCEDENRVETPFLWFWPLGMGFSIAAGKKQWKQNSHYFCALEFTLLSNDSADTQRLLCFQFAGCSSIFSTPAKPAVSKYPSDISPFP